jgi:hypothetical protein
VPALAVDGYVPVLALEGYPVLPVLAGVTMTAGAGGTY